VNLQVLRQLAFVGILLLGSMAAANADWSSEQSELISLSDAWIAAEVGHDKAALERILDERFLATFASSGKTVDRSAYVAWIMQMQIDPFTVVNEVVNIYGNTALVISTEGATKFTWVAVKNAGQWVVISETFSRISETR
jgi:Domain of unknown function (DUF4440)